MCPRPEEMDRVIAVIKALLPKGPDGSRIPSPSQLRLVLLKNIPLVQRIHACSQDCVLFRGPFAKLKRCPKCSRLRYFQSVTGHLIPVNVFRAIPIGCHLRLLFADPTTARAMRMRQHPVLDSQTRITDITGSVGFNEVVFESGFMDDSRNVVLLGGTDGGNPFHRERVSTYSLWPFVFNVLNFDPVERSKFANVFLGGLVSGHV